MTIFVTGGSGFIGSNFIIEWFSSKSEPLINIDLLTYAGNKSNLKSVETNNNYFFIHGDICDEKLLLNLYEKFKPRAIINFAAESHVDRSIIAPDKFLKTNVLGTFNLLETSKLYWQNLSEEEKNKFRFLHVSTDEVYGTLTPEEQPFSEKNQYQPNSPYSASKASSDHFVRAYYHTYGLPTITTNCSNNYGPYQFPEKLIPLVINNALNGKEIPIYGDGKQVRDWLFVGDHCSAINAVLEKGRLGETYNIGGLNEKTNIEIVNAICNILEKLQPSHNNPHLNGNTYHSLKKFVTDRPGHDRRYAVNTEKINKELEWNPIETFETGINKTIQWYLNNQSWIQNIVSGEYQNWIKKQYK